MLTCKYFGSEQTGRGRGYIKEPNCDRWFHISLLVINGVKQKVLYTLP